MSITTLKEMRENTDTLRLQHSAIEKIFMLN